MSDIRFMQRALELAKLGFGSVSPNPMVGCVVVYDNKIIGEGFHMRYGEPHAEVNAINSIIDHTKLSESTVYVTLEPCAHHGKTPPCSDLLIEKKVKKVVIACQDPFKQVDGKGIEKLKNTGIEVGLGVLEKEALDLNKRFFTFHTKERPYIILKWAQTLDGFIARENFDSKWISNQYSRQLVHKWRAEEDAILVGKNTAIHDNPSLTTRDWEGKNPTRILLDSKLEVKPNFNLLSDEEKTIVINTIKEEANTSVAWVKIDSITPKSVLKVLYKEGIQSVIIEGGAKTLNAFISEKCWDEARVFTSKNQFNKGIKAPEISGTISGEENVYGDQLITYLNTNG